MISSNANPTLPSAIPSSATADTSSYLAKTEPKMEEIDSELNATTGYGRSSNQVGSPSSSSPVVSQQSVIQTSPSLENSISQGHQSSPVVPLTPEAPVVTVSYCKIINMNHNYCSSSDLRYHHTKFLQVKVSQLGTILIPLQPLQVFILESMPPGKILTLSPTHHYTLTIQVLHQYWTSKFDDLKMF